MDLKKQTIEGLKKIVEKDYGVLLSDSEANEFGSSLLRLTRLTIKVSEKNKENQLEILPRQLPDTRRIRT